MDDRNLESVPLDEKRQDAEKTTGDTKEEKKQEDEEVTCVADIVGQWGRFQTRAALIYIVVYIVAPFQNLGITYYTDGPDFRCKKPPGYEFAENQTCTSYINPNEKCAEWEYDHSYYRSTIISEFDLVCENSWYISASKSIYQVGYLIASILFGWMSDKYGRRFAYLTAICLELVSSLSQALAVNIHHFMLSRFCLGLGAYGRFTCGALLLFEWAGPKRRAQVHPILELGWVAGTILLPALFSVVRHFRYMQLMVFFYEILFVYWLWQTPESPSWLILKGRYQEAEDILTSAIIMNQKGTNADVKRKMGLLRKQILIDEKERIEESQKTLFDLWKSPILLKYCLVMYVISFSMFFVSYGTTYNAGEIVGSLYVTTLFGGFLSIIKHLMTYFIINKFNRKPFAMFFILASAASTLAMIPFALGDYSRWYRVPFGLLGKFLGTPGGTAIGLLQKEIFPTGMRQLASGSCSVAGRIGSIMAPFVRELNQATHVSVSLGLFAALGVCVGFLILLLPETKDKPLPDTLREAESRR